ncbi:hypothetical protein A8709_30775 [Paenibacillus pectinilyticus]|uniref:SLH domain-containing protein n=1 Tax=Paenibacillus pectinilyticus TaxID=512399 RepID=A0A1C0ZVU0_9BACL|nr:S-layer homology domain-containing protein [Paenibacillus pectinilyticus]OCT12226.1 hypothetical protein A8709_30775 [Paenibacillus pectinilyticus]
MKKMFKMMTLSASVLLSLTIASQSFAATTASSFTDLDTVAAKDKIISLQQSGVISGITPELFAPQAAISEAQSVQLMVNAFGLNLDLVRFFKEPKATDYFKNANNEAWYANALITAAVNNLELPADLVPDKKLTREEFTNQLIHAIEVTYKLPMIKPVVTEIKDEAQLNPEYSGSIQRAIQYGVIKLTAEGTFNPKKEITRAEAAEEIFNALAYLKAHTAPAASTEALTAAQGIKLITDGFEDIGTKINIKIDPDAKLTRESFTYLLVHTLQTSGKLPMLNVVPAQIKDNDQIDISNSGAIQTALALGLVTLNQDGNFNPKGEISLSDATDYVDKAVKKVNGFTAPQN